MDTAAVFENLRHHHENEVAEFKSAERSFDFNNLEKYFSALSNEANLRYKNSAWLVFGVTDSRREIIGTSYKNSGESLQKLKQDISQHTTDGNTFRDIYKIEAEGKRVLIFRYQRHREAFRLLGRDISMPTMAKVWLRCI